MNQDYFRMNKILKEADQITPEGEPYEINPLTYGKTFDAYRPGQTEPYKQVDNVIYTKSKGFHEPATPVNFKHPSDVKPGEPAYEVVKPPTPEQNQKQTEEMYKAAGYEKPAPPPPLGTMISNAGQNIKNIAGAAGESAANQITDVRSNLLNSIRNSFKKPVKESKFDMVSEMLVVCEKSSK